MKKHFLILIMASLSLLSACGEKPAPVERPQVTPPAEVQSTPQVNDETTAYSNVDFSFTIDYPKSWKVTEGGAVDAFNVFFEGETGANSFGILPKGESDFGLPSTEPETAEMLLDGKRATAQLWSMEDGKKMMIVKFTELPEGWTEQNRIQFMGDDVDGFEEILKTLKFM